MFILVQLNWIKRFWTSEGGQLHEMTSTLQQTKNAVTLKGSATLISEFFNYGINSILYQVNKISWLHDY